MKRGNIPVLNVEGDSIPEAWENSIVELYNKGLWYKRTGHKDKDRNQVDSTMTITITDPYSNLVFHKFSRFGWDELFEYQVEIMGAKDSWVDSTGKSKRWPYHYHERLTSYPGVSGLTDQIESAIQTLKTKPATRQAQSITWVPERDTKSDDPPCLQNVWFSLVPNDEQYKEMTLNMNYTFRSRNVMIAAPINQFGLLTLQKYIKNRLEKETGKKVLLGRVVDHNFSYHVSAQNQPLLDTFINQLAESKTNKKNIEDRCMTREMIFPMMDESKLAIQEKLIRQTKKYVSEEKLEQEIERIKQIFQIVSEINQKALEE